MNRLRPVLAVLASLAVLACARPAPQPVEGGAQLLGTVNDTRGAWNPFLAENDMAWDPAAGEYARRVALSATGGRNGDGIYALRFSVGKAVAGACKPDPAAPAERLVCGEAARGAGNALLAVAADGEYEFRFSPSRKTWSVQPPLRLLTTVESMQINGFVHDAEGERETVVNGRTRPAERWDETRPSHEMAPTNDGGWTRTLRLSAKGGHNRDGVYQFLFSAGGNGDWGFCAHNGEPGALLGGCGYNSRTGAVDESAVVIRVPRDGDYAITAHPGRMRLSVSPPVELLNELNSFQLNGSVMARPWALSDPEHQMVRRADGLWQKTVTLSPNGGEARNGVYVMNFSIGALWALDGVASGGRWGHVWHAVPQEHNILFRALAAGPHTVVLDPVRGQFSVEPPVQPLEAVTSLKIAGSFESLADDGGKGWNLSDARHAMRTADGRLYAIELPLTAGRTYQYKYAANDAGWAWGLADYPYDGERRLAPHGDPPPLAYAAQKSGPHRFEADVVSGRYTVTPLGD